MEFREVTPVESGILLERSANIEHPFYYLFRYSLTEHRIIAKRIRKKAITFSNERKKYHTIELDPGCALHKAIKRIEDIKAKYLRINNAEY